MENIAVDIIDKKFGPHDLLELVKAVDRINNIKFTEQITVALRLINNPPFISSPIPIKEWK